MVDTSPIPNTRCFFVSDLHGRAGRYRALFDLIERERPGAVFLGGDLLPSGFQAAANGAPIEGDFVLDFLCGGFERLRESLGDAYPAVCLILGNDDPRAEEHKFETVARSGTWRYIHDRHVRIGPYDVYGYAYVPPTPFQLKDWERYDVSRYVDPGCVSPEEGARSVAVDAVRERYATIKDDLDALVDSARMEHTVMLFHSPPYETKLDRAALDGKMIDHVPLDVHVGSIAIRRFIERHQPLVTMHGHIHESTRLTGQWHDQLGRTHMFNAAHDGDELALLRIDLDDPGSAMRALIAV
jgi:Icc-related predicted phosphoesterase